MIVWLLCVLAAYAMLEPQGSEKLPWWEALALLGLCFVMGPVMVGISLGKMLRPYFEADAGVEVDPTDTLEP